VTGQSFYGSILAVARREAWVARLRVWDRRIHAVALIISVVIGLLYANAPAWLIPEVVLDVYCKRKHSF